MKSMIFNILKIIIPAIITTVVCILMCAFIMLRMDVEEEYISRFVMAIYLIATFVMGFMAGKIAKEKKYLWGMISGFSYFVVIVALSFMFKESAQGMSVQKALFFCLTGGTLGGMLS